MSTKTVWEITDRYYRLYYPRSFDDMKPLSRREKTNGSSTIAVVIEEILERQQVTTHTCID